ncbi:MAG: hypothetical protein J6K01_00825 [Paludibacteraceae bacterium]|jgi:hypothetical protein|nr:hypothetical protein [Prevotella sp.]MBP3466142.1 hypothetical protein [Paludibacteraceae bacterium]MBR6076869.1 hypothetical protein [Paludibacteraceae bacterium]MBR6804602.1 hypothetical protein [Paludibacteraceae bacterium]
MKTKVLAILAVISASLFSMKASAASAPDIYYYQDQFNEITEIIQYGDAPRDSVEFDELVEALKVLYSDLANDHNVKKKAQLLADIKSVCLFMGEISPDIRSYYLSIEEKNRALNLLGLQEKVYSRSSRFCMPICYVKMWNGAYTAYYAINENDSLMNSFKFSFSGRTPHTTISGSVEEGASKSSVRLVFSTFGDVKELSFRQEHCEALITDMTYIQPEIIQPKVDIYPEPDYLTKEEKQALKKKQKAKLKKDKEKAKKQAQKAKNRKKKEMAKQREEMRKKALKERQANMAEQKKARAEQLKAQKKKK